MHCKTDEEYGQHCLKHTFPEFRGRAAGGQNIIVAGKAFGCGSSRECAVNALIGAGIKCVIARSFAFIYGRNQANLGLLGIVMDDEEFYRLAEDGRDISISLSERSIKLGDRQWNFNVSKMELELIASGGVTPAFRRFGHKLFEAMCSPARRPLTRDSNRNDVENEVLDCGSRAELQW
jgi:3-isopropylmalate dehydratase small subunit